MFKKLAMPVAYGDMAEFTIAGSDAKMRSLRLSALEVKKGVLSWEMTADDGELIVGNATASIQNPLFRGNKQCWIKPCMPIKAHVRNGALAIEILFQVPNACFISIRKNAA